MEFITLFSGAAAAWPLPLSAQPPGQMRRIGVLESTGRRRSDIATAPRGVPAGWIVCRHPFQIRTRSPG
jgi:hypothetical protein